MNRVIYAISAAGIALVFACATSFAAPIAQIPTTAMTDNVTQAYYYHGAYYPYHYHGHYYHRRGWDHGHWRYW
jgi:hypothetical protein